MKNTSMVRRRSRVASSTPMVQCSAMDHGACGRPLRAISVNGAQYPGRFCLRSQMVFLVRGGAGLTC